jgi:TolB-like protein/DNA-binding winged helix-turn-helix (wHTH) protein
VPTTLYRFGNYELNPSAFELKRNSSILKIERIPMELLILLLDKEGQVVTRQEIVDRLWGKDVFVDTEAGINTAVRKIRHALRENPDKPLHLQTVTGKGYRFVGAVKQTLEPAPIPQSTAVPVPQRFRGAIGFPTHTIRWLLLVVVVGLVIGGWSLRRTLEKPQPIRSIAVLPLLNVSSNPDQDYFAVGMTDELITMLARNSNLRVTSHTTVMQYKDAHRALPDIARDLHVDAILEGSVSRSDNDIHLNLQLIRGDTDSHLWADSFDRDVHDTELASEAATAVADRLGSKLPPHATRRSVSPAAYDAFLRGKYLWFTDRMLESGDYFKKATELQPDYAEAWAWLSAFYSQGVAGSVLDPRTNVQPEWDTAQKALALDPDLPDAHWAMGAAYFIGRWDFANADREFQLAIHMDPQNAESYYVRACLLAALGRFDEAIALGKKTMELAPFERPDARASILIEAQQYDAALREIQLRDAASEDSHLLLLDRWDIARRMRDDHQMIELAGKWYDAIGQPQVAAELRRAYAKGGRQAYFQAQLQRRLKQAKTQFVSPGELAMYYAELGNKNRALEELEEACRIHAIESLWIQDEPAFNFLHADPRYRALVQRVGARPMYDRQN